MKKSALLKKIIVRLEENLDLLETAARSSRAEATHESSKAESKYDTRGLEAGYLASGQARHAREIMESIQVYKALPLREFAPGEPVDVTALVEVALDGTRSSYFIGPRNGGLEVTHAGVDITVITPQSPLGEHLMGKAAGQRWTAKLGGATAQYQLVSVC